MRTLARLLVVLLIAVATSVGAGEPPSSADQEAAAEAEGAPNLSIGEAELLGYLRWRKAEDERLFRARQVPDVGRRTPNCLAADGADACAHARAIAEMGACTRAEDCPAVEAWIGLLGPPSLQLAAEPGAEDPSAEEAAPGSGGDQPAAASADGGEPDPGDGDR